MLAKLPKVIILTIFLIKALDLKEAIKLIQGVTYLWREFYIKVKVKPIIESFKVLFYYEDERLCGTEIKDLKDLLKLIDDVQKMRAIDG